MPFEIIALPALAFLIWGFFSGLNMLKNNPSEKQDRYE